MMFRSSSQKNNYRAWEQINQKVEEIITLDPWFYLIKTGEKKVEAKLYKDNFKTLTPGQKVLFTNAEGTEKISRTIKSVQVYKDFKTLLESENLGEVLPGIDSVEEGLRAYSFPKEEEKQYGLLAISFQA
eukprot:TRINITY_DN3561_c0_g1_i1.p1 TRINITY_DN3561_c0_g1~~TRINITY_DN3561_c0_g1_i1.p1  ORF type:complete len:130 (+),score=24.87 TRINITY_DN3561_c0_g1_i1:63-452(+)